MAHDMLIKDAQLVNRRARSRQVGTAGSGEEVHVQYTGVLTANYRALGYEHVSVGTASAVALGASLAGGVPPSGATHALLVVESGGTGVRYRQDGASPASVPTDEADTGPLVVVGSALELAPVDSANAPTLDDVRLVAVGGTTLVVVEYRAYY